MSDRLVSTWLLVDRSKAKGLVRPGMCYDIKMRQLRSITSVQVLVLLVALLIWKVTFSIVWEYRNYVPPNFGSDFLFGRESYFWNGYHRAFYVHLLAGPPALLLGTVLISRTLRRRSVAWHRRLGRVQVALVLLMLAPSGLWMAGFTASDPVAGVGLGLLAVATAVCAWCGWRSAVAKRFTAHRRWMWRTFLLLCSAVVLRILGGLATVLHGDAEWLYGASIWASWVVPLLIFEISSSSSSLVRKRTLPSSIAP